MRPESMTGEALKQWRARMGMTQTELARALGVDSVTVSRWERDATPTAPYLALALATVARRETDRTKKRTKLCTA